MSYSHYLLVPAGPSAPRRSFHLSPSSLSLQLLPMPEEHLQHYSFTSRLCHRLLGGALDCRRLKASLLLSPPPEMRHPGTHSPKGTYKSSILPEILLLSPIRSRGEAILREKQSAAAAGAGQQRGKARQDGRPRPASTPGHTNNAGSRECCNCQGKHQSAVARQSLQPKLMHNYMSSARARRPGD